MRKVSVGDMVLLNGFVAALALGCAGFYFGGSCNAIRIADGYVGKPELIASHFYDQGRYEKLKVLAVQCEVSKDEFFVGTLRAPSSTNLDTGLILSVLGILFLLNAYLFRSLRMSDGQSHSNS